MPQMIVKDGELIRISPKDPKKLEFSTNNGLTWGIRYNGIAGTFYDLVDAGKEVIAQTDKGLYFSTNKCRTFMKRR